MARTGELTRDVLPPAPPAGERPRTAETHGARPERAPPAPSHASHRVDFGWVVLGRPDPIDLDCIQRARAEVQQRLESDFPDYDWRLPLVESRDPAPALREKPVALLEHGIYERDRRSWDYVLVITDAELITHEKPFALGVPSQSVNVAVLSTARIDPVASSDGEVEPERRRDCLTRRIRSLTLHLFGHLNGLEHDADPRSWMHDIQLVSELDSMEHYSPGATSELEAALAAAADPRLEERSERLGTLAFYIGAVRLNFRGIVNAVASTRPWLLPLRLSRFTAAGASTLMILLVTAEIWELGTSQPPSAVIAFSVLALTATTVFVVKRQRVLLRRGGNRLTEQTVATNVAIVVTIALGLVTTYFGLLAFAAIAGWFLFPPEVVLSWTTTASPTLAASRYLCLAGFIASFGILIGGLGATFEEQDYFRHTAYVDEET